MNPTDSKPGLKMTVSCLGPPGTFSHLAAQKKFPGANHLPVRTIPAAVANVSQGKTDLAIIPLENSIGGKIDETLRALREYKDVVVIDQFLLPIHLSLIAQKQTSGLQPKGKKDKINFEGLKFLASKDNVFGQCSEWIKENLSRAKRVRVSSTAAAAKLAANDPAVGAIGHQSLAKRHGLRVLARKIENQKNNQTTFIVLKRK